MKGFADDNINVIQKLKFVWGKVENVVGKGANAGYQHFFLFPQYLQKPSFSGSLKVGLFGKSLKAQCTRDFSRLLPKTDFFNHNFVIDFMHYSSIISQ